VNNISLLPTSTERIENWLIGTTAKHSGIAQEGIAVDQPFASYGLDSLAATMISADLEDWMGMQLDPTLLWDYPTIRDLASHLVTLAVGKGTRAKLSESSLVECFANQAVERS
jgi:acyl carrier protein